MHRCAHAPMHMSYVDVCVQAEIQSNANDDSCTASMTLKQMTVLLFNIKSNQHTQLAIHCAEDQIKQQSF